MHLSLKNKIITFTTIFLLLIIAGLLTSVWGLGQIHQAKEEATIANKIQDDFQELRILWEMSLMGPHDYIIHKGKHELDIFMEDYKRLADKKQSLSTLIATYNMRENLVFGKILEKAEANFSLLKQELEEYKAKALDIFNLDLPSEMHKAGYYMEEMDLLVREVEKNLQGMGLVMEEFANEALEKIHIIHHDILILLAIFGIVALFLGIILGHHLTQSITMPVDYLVQAARRIKTGDLTARARVKTKDEIGELANSFNEMIGQLVDIQEDISNILHSSGDAVRVIDNNFNIIRTNKQMKEFLGSAPVGIKDKKCYEIFYCEHCRTEGCYLQRILKGEEWIKSETSCSIRDGRQVPVEIIITPYKKKGQIVGIIESIRDVSEREKAQKDLHESQKKLKTIFDTIQTGIFMIDSRTHKILEANQVAVDLLGASKEQVLGAECHQFVCPAERGDCPITDLKQIVDKSERVLLTVDGRKLPILKSVVEVELDGRRCLIEGFVDISRQKMMEEQLSMAKDMAEAANKAKSEFLANMSHEIRTPLNGVIGMTDLALGTELSLQQQEYLHMAKTSAGALLGVLNDILDFSKIEAGRLDLEEIDFDLRSSMESIADTLALKAFAKGLEFAYYLKPEVPLFLNGDPGRLRQIIINLANNAIKFTDTGQVLIECQIESKGEKSAMLHFSVSDTGIGIPLGKQKVIFDSFSQADGSITRKYGGTGLGLAICRQLSEMMGGRIWVESKEDKGSAFHFTAGFGIQAAKDRPVWETKPVELQGLRVLIVDDNAVNRMILQNMVSDWGLLPQEAQDGQSAIIEMGKAVTEGRPYHLLLLDLHMPQMDGFKVSNRLQQDKLLSEVKIILLTSAGQRGDSVRCREAGISAYLPKPVKYSQLFKAIKSVLGQKTPEEATGRLITRHTILEERPMQTLRVLLAENNPIDCKFMVALLKKEGHFVLTAQDGQEVLKILESQAVDLVFMDMQMPVMDGFEATGRIREREKTTGGRLPIIAMTAHALKGDKEKCLEAGMDGYISKPIEISKLKETMRQIIPEKLAFKEKPEPVDALPPGPEHNFDSLLESFDGDLEWFQEIFALFVKEYPPDIETIRGAIAENDGEKLGKAVHRFKGAVSLFNVPEITELVLELEVMGKEGKLQKAQQTLSKLEFLMSNFMAGVKNILQKEASLSKV